MGGDQQSSDALGYAGAGTVRPQSLWRRLLAWGIGTTAVVVLALLVIPQGGSGQERANRVKCASNLRQIGLAIQLYAYAHSGKLPDDFPSLLQAEDLSPGPFVCPSSPDEIASGPTTQAVMAAMKKPGALSYIYLGKGLTSADLNQNPDIVLAYEPLSNHGGSGMNVLFGDGSVEWVQGPGAQKILSQASSAQRPAKLPQNQR